MGNCKGKKLKLDAVLSAKRLTSLPHECRTRYKLCGVVELCFSELAHLPISLEFVSKEQPGDLYQLDLELSACAGSVSVKEMHELPALPGDCWSIVDHLRGTVANATLQGILALFVARVCESLNRPMIRLIKTETTALALVA